MTTAQAKNLQGWEINVKNPFQGCCLAQWYLCCSRNIPYGSASFPFYIPHVFVVGYIMFQQIFPLTSKSVLPHPSPTPGEVHFPGKLGLAGWVTLAN